MNLYICRFAQYPQSIRTGKVYYGTPVAGGFLSIIDESGDANVYPESLFDLQSEEVAHA